MARVTVEDCLPLVDNRFALVLLAAKRARQLMAGARPIIDTSKNKPPVLSLRVIAAIKAQADKLLYANPYMATDVRARLGQKLSQIAPGDLNKAFFTLGGSEANENAIKIARMVTGRNKIVVRYRSYHGGTSGS